MPVPCGVPLSVLYHSSLYKTPALSNWRISRRIRGSAVLCATIRSRHSLSTESEEAAANYPSSGFPRYGDGRTIRRNGALFSAGVPARRQARADPRPWTD